MQASLITNDHSHSHPFLVGYPSLFWISKAGDFSTHRRKATTSTSGGSDAWLFFLYSRRTTVRLLRLPDLHRFAMYDLVTPDGFLLSTASPENLCRNNENLYQIKQIHIKTCYWTLNEHLPRFGSLVIGWRRTRPLVQVPLLRGPEKRAAPALCATDLRVGPKKS